MAVGGRLNLFCFWRLITFYFASMCANMLEMMIQKKKEKNILPRLNSFEDYQN